jgi:hypothetical protein
MNKNRVIRTRIFIAGEGQSEQSFNKRLQELTDSQNFSLHLDYKSLNGGGYKSMYHNALSLREKGLRRGKYSHSLLLVDSDRSDRRDCPGDWSLKQLKAEAAKDHIRICVQYPNHEGLLFRILSNEDKDKKKLSLTPTKARERLRNIWPEYEKGTDALTLSRKLFCDGLMRAAHWDPDLKDLLVTLGLISV